MACRDPSTHLTFLLPIGSFRFPLFFHPGSISCQRGRIGVSEPSGLARANVMLVMSTYVAGGWGLRARSASKREINKYSVPPQTV